MGDGVLQSKVKGFEWSLKAAENGDSRCQHLVGGYYAEGDGVRKDLKLAKKWVALADENGEEGANETWKKYKLWKY